MMHKTQFRRSFNGIFKLIKLLNYQNDKYFWNFPSCNEIFNNEPLRYVIIIIDSFFDGEKLT